MISVVAVATVSVVAVFDALQHLVMTIAAIVNGCWLFTVQLTNGCVVDVIVAFTVAVAVAVVVVVATAAVVAVVVANDVAIDVAADFAVVAAANVAAVVDVAGGSVQNSEG